ncbi:hypothetical protein X801_03329 [Opisthorchis viverrini]|uniref:Uncharacterized protein n=1 Tax=Opisthorchis viverrini TaxID=6198 RepID=A0A1S8X2R7_OPIVI|nr:hypothetical protein X801_03329 [Opisthorchis viverrini]
MLFRGAVTPGGNALALGVLFPRPTFKPFSQHSPPIDRR